MDFVKRLAGMSAAQMRKSLSNRRRKLPEDIIDGIIAVEKARRRKLHPMRKKREQHVRLWKQLLDPAVVELRNVQRMLNLSLTYPTPERETALTTYAGVIARVVGKMQINIDKLRVHEDQLDDDLLTPGQQASKRTPAFPHGKPNGGEHWVDYVPIPVIKKVRALFEAIPKTRHVRRKEPFPVTLPIATSAKLRAVLRERTQKELDHTERLMAAELADTRLTDTHVFKHQEINALRAQISKMQSALHLIGQLPANAFVPPSWHGILTERTYPGRSPLLETKKSREQG
jgi:hypothetical protein